MAEAKEEQHGKIPKMTAAEVREARLARLRHWDDIRTRLQHRWSAKRVETWHRERYPAEEGPAWRTLHRYLKEQTEGFFVKPLLLAEAGNATLSRILVVEKQAELIQFQAERMVTGREFERQLGGFLSPQVSREVEIMARLLELHHRTQQDAGLEPKVTQGGTRDPDDPAGSYVRELSEVVHRFVNLPEGEFMPAVIALIGPPAVKQPLVLEGEGFVVDQRQAREERDADPAG